MALRLDSGDIRRLREALRIVSFYDLPIEQEVYSPPSQITTVAGTYVSGDVASVSGWDDGDEYHVDEAAGAPGFNIEIQFDNVRAFNQILCRAMYNGSLTHDVRIGLWNYNVADWRTMIVVPATNYLAIFHAAIPEDAHYLQNGTARIRFYHSTNGNPSHDIAIAYASLRQGYI